MPSMAANSVQVLWGEMHEYGVEPNHRTHIVMDKDPALIDMVLTRLSPFSLVKACGLTFFVSVSTSCVYASTRCRAAMKCSSHSCKVTHYRNETRKYFWLLTFEMIPLPMHTRPSSSSLCACARSYSHRGGSAGRVASRRAVPGHERPGGGGSRGSGGEYRSFPWRMSE